MLLYAKSFIYTAPNGLAFSCRERAGQSLSKTLRSRARSGRLELPRPHAVAPHQRNPYAITPIAFVYHTISVDQQFRPDPPLEMIIPCWNMVPNHAGLPHWWQNALGVTDPDQKGHAVVVIGAG